MNSTPAKLLQNGLISPRGVFVTSNNDIYVNSEVNDSRVQRWTPNATNGTTVMNGSSFCYGLFVDINNTLYCSLDSSHMVVKNSLNDGINTAVVLAAGTGTSGSTATQLNGPNGIFVDTQLNLYVADCNNNRVQFFVFNQLSATTVAGGTAAAGTITLNCPVDIIFDGDGFLFIADFNNDRIIGSGPAGYRCIVGCTGMGGSSAYQLNNPRSLAFDSEGNLLVVDTTNSRVQKFQLATNTCSKSGEAASVHYLEMMFEKLHRF